MVKTTFAAFISKPYGDRSKRNSVQVLKYARVAGVNRKYKSLVLWKSRYCMPNDLHRQQTIKTSVGGDN